jgi:hypothetical protein
MCDGIGFSTGTDSTLKASGSTPAVVKEQHHHSIPLRKYGSHHDDSIRITRMHVALF